METNQSAPRQRVTWNKGKLVGQKAPFKPKDVWALRAYLEQGHRTRELALLNLGIDSKLRGCDLVALKLREIQRGAQIAPRAIITQHKTGRSVQFEIPPPTRAAVQAWVTEAGIKPDGYPFPSRIHGSPHICARQYARRLRGWVRDVGLDWTAYGTHSLRRTKAALIYQKTKNLRAVQLLLGHSKLESTVRYLGVDAHDALEISEQTEI